LRRKLELHIKACTHAVTHKIKYSLRPIGVIISVAICQNQYYYRSWFSC